jgi:hypothetical protein
MQLWKLRNPLPKPADHPGGTWVLTFNTVSALGPCPGSESQLPKCLVPTPLYKWRFQFEGKPLKVPEFVV